MLAVLEPALKAITDHFIDVGDNVTDYTLTSTFQRKFKNQFWHEIRKRLNHIVPQNPNFDDSSSQVEAFIRDAFNTGAVEEAFKSARQRDAIFEQGQAVGPDQHNVLSGTTMSFVMLDPVSIDSSQPSAMTPKLPDVRISPESNGFGYGLDDSATKHFAAENGYMSTEWSSVEPGIQHRDFVSDHATNSSLHLDDDGAVCLL